jgi:hypothetical protein
MFKLATSNNTVTKYSTKFKADSRTEIVEITQSKLKLDYI